jgi:23S rRNA (cytidine1920-2'-O)/16S rRNA (cytidine1409-2'-O)-methyltransferase
MSKKVKKRLDVILVEKGLVDSRNKAQSLIMSGVVSVNDTAVRKAGALISPESHLKIFKKNRFVSRGGEKLDGALIDLNLSPKNRVCIDVGASTGGFTDCLVQHGAKLVYAIDVGRSQMVDALKKDRRVFSMEKTHILHMDRNQLHPKPNFATIDVSFISLKKVLPKVKTLLDMPGTICALLKPQFEVGAKNLKKGVVKSDTILENCLNDMIEFGKREELHFGGYSPSRLKGPKGNQEFFLHFEKATRFI